MTKIYHDRLYGSRDSKYDWLQNHDVLSTDWLQINPQVILNKAQRSLDVAD
jgi:hypothetical protein